MIIPVLQHVDAGDDPYPAPPEGPEPYCELCSRRFPVDEFSEMAFDATGFAVCQQCIEEMLEANACAVQP